MSTNSFCTEYPPVWYNEFNFNDIEPTFKELRDFILANNTTNHYVHFYLEEGGEHSVYLPYGTIKIEFTIPNRTSVATCLLKINGIPSISDVDIATSPHDWIRSGESNICPYTKLIYNLYGEDILIDEISRIQPNWIEANLICSHPNTLWYGKTFNAVSNIIILLVPKKFWNHHPKGVWLVYDWKGGINQYRISITIDKNIFDSWYNNLSYEERMSFITCPLNANDTEYTGEDDEDDNQNNNQQNITTIPSSFLKIRNVRIQGNSLFVTFENALYGPGSGLFIWDFDGHRIRNSPIVEQEFSWDYIMKENGLQCKLELWGQLSPIATDSIYIFGLKGTIENQSTTSENDVVIEMSYPWKLLLWIKRDLS